MNNINTFISYEDVLTSQQIACNEFLANFSHYVELFKELDIQLTITPCYYYNAKFHTKVRKKGACVLFRIRLYPQSLTFEQAKKSHLSKEFFSHKIISYNETQQGYTIKRYSSTDKFLKSFLSDDLYQRFQQ